MIDIIRVWLISQSWFWRFRARISKISFLFENGTYKRRTYVSKAKANVRILGSFTWVGLNSFFWVVLTLSILGFVEDYLRSNTVLLKPLSTDDKKFNIDQLRLYAQLLTAIFSIYFATIGIILSTGYTRLRRDIIQLLTTEQIGSIYSRLLVLSAVFCLGATALQLFGFEPGLFIYAMGTFLTLISSLALFPLGQRLFNFFNLNQLARCEILPRIARHIEGAANPNNSISLANHHSKVARSAFEQLCYIDDRMKGEKVGLADNLPALSDDYTVLLLHYIHQKHRIGHQSYWFPRRQKHNQWFFVGDLATTTALQTSSQLSIEEEVNHQWLENVIIERLIGHIELAFEMDDFKLGLELISRFSLRISTYAMQFQFDIGMRELQRMKELIEKAFVSSDIVAKGEKATLQIGIADSWAALGSNLCLETLRRMITFERELIQFFNDDVWTEKSLQTLPPFLQIELAFIIERIKFEREIEGERLSKPKYVQQLAVQKLLQKYVKILPTICDFYGDMIPNFVSSLTKMKMLEAATQVILASLHNYWKLPNWFDEISQLLERYGKYNHYPEKHYGLPNIDIADMIARLAYGRDEAIAMLSRADIVSHIFEGEHNDELPDHFGQIYFELAEACIQYLEQNDEKKLNKVFPMFMSLALVAANSKFVDPALDVNDEFRLHLISSVINDLASVLGFAILYSNYFDNTKLSEAALDKLKLFIDERTEKQQYLTRMIRLSNPHSFSWSASPRDMIRLNWKMAFERRARLDGFDNQIGMGRGKTHKNKIVREFLRSRSDPSHLFFAIQVLPELASTDFEIDYHITSLARCLDKRCDKDSE
ncbi:hypothetical protein [Pectobacterium brasiliense]|uniref:hypothetical protein n=1 Tax=Pectobacterium brasiliense TaxID=180957 RepID=UPI000650D2C5|nr:hypothetical protein [Pectobacterium brasiliense]KMK84620.1 hypothetical protein KCO_11105 [Pectobacterium brasiliense ICMP 19477]